MIQLAPFLYINPKEISAFGIVKEYTMQGEVSNGFFVSMKNKERYRFYDEEIFNKLKGIK
jgi:hypothetical protein